MSTATVLAPAALESVVQLARDHLHEPLNLTDLADHAGYSPFHFTRLFTAATGIAPGLYLTALRMDAAKRMLLTDSAPVVDVCTAVGFDSLSSFSRRFRASVGIPPAHLRRVADRISDRPPRPFSLVAPNAAKISITLAVDPMFLPRGDLSVWVGWYDRPAPIGLPGAGALVEYGDVVDLPLSPGCPWLLGFAVPTDSDPLDQLAPRAPLVAVHPEPLHAAGSVTLQFGPANPFGVPLLTALPSLFRRSG